MYSNWFFFLSTFRFFCIYSFLSSFSFPFYNVFCEAGVFFINRLWLFFNCLSIFLSSLYNWAFGGTKGLTTLVTVGNTIDVVATQDIVGTETVVGRKTFPGGSETRLLVACSQTSYR